jgi:hypothetical protein
MCLKYRMSNTNSGSANSGGILNAIGNVFGKAKNAVVGKPKNNSSNSLNTSNASNASNAPNTSKSVMPASTGIRNVPVTTGGMAPVNFRYGANMQQPSEEVMKWATTAGAPMPPAAMMRNVAHGGKRRTKRRSGHKKRRSMRRKSTNRRRSCGGKRRRTMRRKRYNKRK